MRFAPLDVVVTMKRTDPFSLRDVVYLKMADGKRPGMVTGVTYREVGVLVHVAWPHLNGEERSHWPMELSREYEPSFDNA